MWGQWEEFMADYPCHDPYLRGTPPSEQLCFLKVFNSRVRDGRRSASGKPVSAKRVQDYLRTVAQEIARLGTGLDPRMTANHLPHPDLINIKKAQAKADPPPEKTKPIPVSLVEHACMRLQFGDFARTCSHLLIIGFFYLLRPGEYTYDPKNNHPFRMCDVTFHTPSGPVNAATGSIDVLMSATKVLLNFTDQKNGVRDEAISHSDTPHPLLSPLKATLAQVLHLRANQAPLDTPLHTAYVDGVPTRVTASHLTAALRSSCFEIGPRLGIHPQDISARALRAGGATALLRSGFSPLDARLMGRWRSWAMIEYLHNSVLDTSAYASKMLAHGDFLIPPHQKLPSDVLAMVQPFLLG
jgi:hypothetical protein